MVRDAVAAGALALRALRARRESMPSDWGQVSQDSSELISIGCSPGYRSENVAMLLLVF